MANGTRIPPQNIEAEMSVLGSVLRDREKLTSVMETLKRDDFYREEHRDIYAAMLALFDKGNPIDILTVEEQLRKEGALSRAGGIPYLGELAAGVLTSESAKYYAGIVAQKSLLRKLIKECQHIVDESFSGGEDAEDIIESAENAIFQIMEDRNSAGVTHVKDILNEIYDRLTVLYNSKSKYTGIQTGFYLLDDKTLGLQNSDLILLAARPSMGKSALAANIAFFIAVMMKVPAIYFSLEMSKNQLVNRMICSCETLESNRMRSGKLTEEDWKKVAEATGKMMDAPLYIDDTSGITVSDIKAKCRRLKLEKNGLGLVVIDYIQLMQSAGTGGGGRSRYGNRQEEISAISRSLKLMAKELDVPVLALSQLSRETERRGGRPMLSDLRESGAIEQDADIVMFIYRDEVYNPETEKPGIAEIIIAKHRNGETGTVELMWQGQYTRFVNIDYRQGM